MAGIPQSRSRTGHFDQTTQPQRARPECCGPLRLLASDGLGERTSRISIIQQGESGAKRACPSPAHESYTIILLTVS